MKIKKGDVFKIQTKIGYGFLQFIVLTPFKLHYIRVLDHISLDGNITQFEVNKKERWCTEFALLAANGRKIVEKVDSFLIPSEFKISRYARSKHIIPNKISG